MDASTTEFTEIKTFYFISFLQSLSDYALKLPNLLINLDGPIPVYYYDKIIGYASLVKQDNILVAHANLEYECPERLTIESETGTFQLCPSFEVKAKHLYHSLTINSFTLVRAKPDSIDRRLIITKSDS